MKYVVIGASGHTHQIADAMNEGACRAPLGVAAGSAGEDARPLAKGLGCEFYGDWRDMLDSISPDVCVVNPWFSDISDISAECLKRGINVYSEKPLATEREKLASLKQTWRESGKGLGCMLNLNCCGWFKAVVNAINDGEIGNVRMIHGQKSYRMGVRGANYFKRSDYGGTIPWIAIHAIDWALLLGGKPEMIQAAHSRVSNGGHGDMEATSAILMRLQNGVIATISADFLRPTASLRHDDDRIRVTGDRGMLEVIDARVYLENDKPRRELEKPLGENPFTRFLRTLGTNEGEALTLQAFDDTETALIARNIADFEEVNCAL